MLSLRCSLPLDRSSSRFTNAYVGRSLAMPRTCSLIGGESVPFVAHQQMMYAVLIAIALLYNAAVCAANEESCSADGIKECSGQNFSVLNGKNVKSLIPCEVRPLFLKQARSVIPYVNMLHLCCRLSLARLPPPDLLQSSRLPGVWGEPLWLSWRRDRQ